MSLISEVITAIRSEVSDDDSIRWTDAQILGQVKRAVTRANLILSKHDIHFAKSSSTFSTVVDTATYALPDDFGSPVSLWNRTDDFMLRHITDNEFEYITSPATCTYWRINGSDIEIAATPTEVDPMIFYYWPLLATSAYTVSSTMPWGGKCDDMVVEYASLRLKNIDEMTPTVDIQLSDEFERLIISAFRQLEPSRGVRGFSSWL